VEAKTFDPSAANRLVSRVVATLVNEGRPGRHRVTLSYRVFGARWVPSYDLRYEPARRIVHATYYAVVDQKSGEDWAKARLRFSTGLPTQLLSVPELPTLTLGRKRDFIPTPRPRHEPAPTPWSPSPSPHVRDPVLEHLASLLVVAHPSRVTVEKPVEKKPQPVPDSDRDAVTNPFDFPMLAGAVSLFSDRTYLGQIDSKLRAPGEPLEFSLGVDNQLQVHRYVKKQKLEGPGTFGSKKRLRHRYLIQVGNWTSRPQTVRVLENVPVSQVRDVQVALSGDTTTPKSFDKTDGILAWEVRLSPRSKKRLILDYTVVLPKSWEVRGY
jgi:hypothetical protein